MNKNIFNKKESINNLCYVIDTKLKRYFYVTLLNFGRVTMSTDNILSGNVQDNMN